MNKAIQRKLLKITLLLTLLTIANILTATIPTAHAAPQPSIQENAMSLLNEVIGVKTEIYATS